jgi:hypothetical protein
MTEQEKDPLHIIGSLLELKGHPYTVTRYLGEGMRMFVYEVRGESEDDTLVIKVPKDEKAAKETNEAYKVMEDVYSDDAPNQHIDRLLNLAEELKSRGALQEAKKCVQLVLTLNPSSRSGRRLLGQLAHLIHAERKSSMKPGDVELSCPELPIGFSQAAFNPLHPCPPMNQWELVRSCYGSNPVPPSPRLPSDVGDCLHDLIQTCQKGTHPEGWDHLTRLSHLGLSLAALDCISALPEDPQFLSTLREYDYKPGGFLQYESSLALDPRMEDLWDIVFPATVRDFFLQAGSLTEDNPLWKAFSVGYHFGTYLVSSRSDWRRLPPNAADRPLQVRCAETFLPLARCVAADQDLQHLAIISHGDMHAGNVGVNHDGNIMIIDPDVLIAALTWDPAVTSASLAPILTKELDEYMVSKTEDLIAVAKDMFPDVEEQEFRTSYALCSCVADIKGACFALLSYRKTESERKRDMFAALVGRFRTDLEKARELLHHPVERKCADSLETIAEALGLFTEHEVLLRQFQLRSVGIFPPIWWTAVRKHRPDQAWAATSDLRSSFDEMHKKAQPGAPSPFVPRWTSKRCSREFATNMILLGTFFGRINKDA